MGYIDNKSNLIKQYFNILSCDFPDWLNDYIETDSMKKQQYISVTCGKVYSKLFDCCEYSSLDHSIGVALIIWNFTHDKKQTLSGLFHDIATPVFKHCVDYLNGDYINQESTEDLTKSIISSSKDITKLLKRDNISIDEVCNYHIYPIADNDTPMLSADRLEYSLSNSLIVFHISSIDEIKNIYNDLEIQRNEYNSIEIGFKTKNIARNFVKITSRLSICYRDDATRFFMQVIADILKKLNNDKIISIEDLYKLKESEVIDIIKSSKYSNVYNKIITSSKVNISKEKPDGIYYINELSNIRYIDPLVNGIRISSICEIAKKMINDNLLYDMNKYVYIDDSFNVLK